MRGMSAAMKEMERLLRKGLMKHEHNPCARWNFGNAKIAVDGNENIKLVKKKPTERVDIIAAWIDAMAAAMSEEKVDVNAAILSEGWSL
jgi:phage terminase large subunit-like protein